MGVVGGDTWYVSLQGDKVVAHSQRSGPEFVGDRLPFKIARNPDSEYPAGTKYVKKVDNGYLVGFNAGEFGASLWWYGEEGQTKYKISDDQIRGFFVNNGDLLAVEGLAHITISEGTLIRLSKDSSNKWVSTRLVDFRDAPYAATVSADGDIFVVTSNMLTRVSPVGDMAVLIDDAFWWCLYPTSVVVTADTTVYIGMRGGVAKIENRRESWETTWLLPSHR